MKMTDDENRKNNNDDTTLDLNHRNLTVRHPTPSPHSTQGRLKEEASQGLSLETTIYMQDMKTIASSTSSTTMTFVLLFTLLSLHLQNSLGFTNPTPLSLTSFNKLTLMSTSTSASRVYEKYGHNPSFTSLTLEYQYTWSSLNMGSKGNEDDNMEDFKMGKPIDLPSLNPQDAGPLYGTCRSVSGVETVYEYEEEESIVGDIDANANADVYVVNGNGNVVKEGVDGFTPNKPIELESLQERPSFFGLEPKSDNERIRDGSGAESPLPLFTGTIILMMSCYFIYLALFSEDVLMDPSMPLAF